MLCPPRKYGTSALMTPSRNLAIFYTRGFFSVRLNRLSYWSLSGRTEINGRTWLRLEICYWETYLLTCLEKEPLNREIGKFSVFVPPLPDRCSYDWSSRELLELWGRSAECSGQLKGCQPLGIACVVHPTLPALTPCSFWSPICTKGTSYVFLFVPRTFLESEYPKLERTLYNNV